ncbi:hypothetical protein GcM1_244049 [Golovinomyces cichoracearum]|uniref:Uncharacterized protein n=1 Tax=Golovinomyces cichoracearum TaxID=62708 RepID=A0A420IFP0_9PEZI|nr:hypothetical protein GcM1_244049 [Golovinomyces cichoracearum]
MATRSFRELPPPAAMKLSQSSLHSHLTAGRSQSLGQFPDPPPQWQGAEDSMRNWLLARAEEDKWRQEEEKTRQEALRLEQLKIEQEMLKTSLQGGIPPFLIPMFFAGIGIGGSPENKSEWNQNPYSQIHRFQQQRLVPLQPSLSSTQPSLFPEQQKRRDSRSEKQHEGPQLYPTASNIYSKAMATNGTQMSSRFAKAYQMSPVNACRPHQISQPKVSKLPKISHEGMPVEPVLKGSSSQNSSEKQSSPPICFHYWQPPTIRGEKIGCQQFNNSSNHESSPKKRKIVTQLSENPSTTHQQQQEPYNLSSFSQIENSIFNPPLIQHLSHIRQRSHSARDHDDYSEPPSGHSDSETLSRETAASPLNQISNAAKNHAPMDSKVHSTSANSVPTLLNLLEGSNDSQQSAKPATHSKKRQSSQNLRLYPPNSDMRGQKSGD